jgi:hypothetical protein
MTHQRRKDQRYDSSSLVTAEREGGQRADTATIADNIPIVSAEALSESRIATGEHEDRLQEAERRAAAAEAARQLAEAARQSAEAAQRLAEAERRAAEAEVRLARLEQQTANGNSLSRCIVIAVVAVLIAAAAAAVAGICGTGHCSATNTTRARADTILSYINVITLSGRLLKYPSISSAEERAVQWLIEDDLGTAVDDEQSLRQRYVLGTLWFLQTTPTIGFGSADFASTWATSIDECAWSDVECDVNGRVTALSLWGENVRGQIPHDLGLLTELTYLSLWKNQLSGTIPSSLGNLIDLMELVLLDNLLSGTIPSSLKNLTALTRLFLNDNQLVGTMPFCKSDQSFEGLVADCMEVNCTCCTNCCPVAFGNIPVSSLCNK